MTTTAIIEGLEQRGRRHEGHDVTAFTPADLSFEWDDERRAFAHQYDRDLHVFVVWSTARPHEAAIMDMVAERFRILAEVEVHWSPDRVVGNFERLYGTAVGGGSTKHEDAGVGPFVLVVAEDPEPVYRYRQNVSGHVELTNVHVAEVKRAARALAGGYSVHSSNSIREFFRDATLILGPARLDGVLARDVSGVRPARETLHSDLVGDLGWEDLAEVVSVLRQSAEYVFLRNFADLPSSLGEDPEIDVLARDQLDFAAIVNGRVRDPHAGAGFETVIAGSPVVFDVRWVGDGYFDTLWQDQVLKRRVWTPQGYAAPRVDDHFFTLLYHAKVQKEEVKAAYPHQLRSLAEELDLPEELATRATEDAVATSLLDGYLSGHGYALPRTADEEVYRNDRFVGLLRLTPVEPTPGEALRSQAWRAARYSRVGRRAAESGRLRALVRGVRSVLDPGAGRKAA